MQHVSDPATNVPVSDAVEGRKNPVTVIKPTHGWVALHLGDLWENRELIWYLAMRDVSARYKRTAVGIAWAVIQPLFAMAIFTVVFGRLAKIPSDGLHYPVFCYAAMLPWQYFSAALSGAANSLVANVHLLTKVHFPRLVIPVACLIPPLIDFCASFMVLVAMMLHFHMEFTERIIFVPIFLLLAMVTALGVGLWMAALTVEFRDFHHVLPFFMQLWMFASPVVYSTSLVPQNLRFLYGFNPIAGVIAGFRWSLLGTQIAPGMPLFMMSVGVSLLLLVTGAFYFRRMERIFADVV